MSRLAPESRFPRADWIFGLILVASCGSVGSRVEAQEKAPAPSSRLDVLPERFFQVQDESGFFWQALDNGALISGETQYLQSGMNLIVDDEPFAPKSGQVREPGSGGERIDLRLDETRSAFTISRDLWFDTKRSGVRILDTITSTSKTDQTVAVVLRTTYPFAWQSLHGTGGGVLGSEPTLQLGERDISLGVHFSPTDGRHDTFFLLGSEKGGQRPELKASANSRELILSYSVPLPAGQTRSLLHWILQRNLPDVSHDLAAFEPFMQRGQWIFAGLGGKQSETLWNLAPSAFPVESTAPSRMRALVALNDFTDRIGLYRRSEDLLRIGPTNQISGTFAREGSIVISAPPLGQVEVKLADLAAIRGGAGEGRRNRFYLRDGRVLAGTLAKGSLLWKPAAVAGAPAAEAQTIDPAVFHALLLATEARDGTPPEKATHFVELGLGTVIAVEAGKQGSLDWVMSWGREPSPWPGLVEAVRRSLPTPHFRVMAKDGSVMAAVLAPGSVPFSTVEGVALDVPAATVERIWTAGESPRTESTAPGGWLDFAEVPAGLGPATGVLLKGDQLIAVEFGTSTLLLRDGSSTIPVETAGIVSLSRSTEPEASHLLTVELAAGERIVGEAVETYVTLKRGDRTLELPFSQLLAFRKGGSAP